MTQKYEIERKFLVLNFSQEMIPKTATKALIVQRYLKVNDRVEVRVRSKKIRGRSEYFYTEKRPTGESGKRIEKEVKISFLRFLWHLSCAFLNDLLRSGSNLFPIIKTRYTFHHEGLTFEVDVYECPIFGTAILEVELSHISERINFPSGWMLKEVTSDPRYKNANLALGSLSS